MSSLTPIARFRKLFGLTRCAVIGMIHAKALPGSPLNEMGIDEIVQNAAEEAQIYADCGVDGVIVENMFDTPYILGECPPELTACMTRTCHRVREVVGPRMVCGVQILAAHNRAALAVAAAAKFNFIRAEGFVFSHIADEGLINACAGDLLRYRRTLGDFGRDIAVFCDIKKKHSAHAITADVSLAETAKNADFFLADGLIVTGASTGSEVDLRDVQEVASAVPDQVVLLGSGVRIDNVEKLTKSCHGVIVGTHFKKGNHWTGALDSTKVRAFVEHLHSLH